MTAAKKAPRVTWRRAIRVAAAGGATGTMVRDLQAAATDWRVCAVGEKLGVWYDNKHFDALGPAVESIDPNLAKLGVMFAVHVSRRQWDDAATVQMWISHRLTPYRIAKIRKAWRHNMRVFGAAVRGSA